MRRGDRGMGELGYGDWEDGEWMIEGMGEIGAGRCAGGFCCVEDRWFSCRRRTIPPAFGPPPFTVRVMEREKLSFAFPYANNENASLGWLAVPCIAVIE